MVQGIAAEDLLKDGHAPEAASKIYYAMYYAAQALLKANGIEVVKHSAVESAFGYYFTKPGKIDFKFHRMLMNARKIKEIADFDIDEEIVEPIASSKIDEGCAFLWSSRITLVWNERDILIFPAYFDAKNNDLRFQNT